MRRALTGLMFLVLAVVLFVLLRGQDDSATDAPQIIERPTAVVDLPAGTSTSAAGSTAAPAEATGAQPKTPEDVRPARVLRLADGDSFDLVWLDTDERDEVRLFGINAPERDACFADGARDVLRALTEDRELVVETIERDEFGRVLGNVWVDGVFVNAALVEVGAALALSDGGRYGELIADAQAYAQSTQAGLWDAAACGATDGAQLRIDWIEANAPGRDDQNKNGEWIVIANDGSTVVDLTGWSVRDESTRHRYFFPDAHRIGVGGIATIYSGCGSDQEDELYWCADDPVWNNGGDTAFLVDPDGRFVDTLSYTG